MGRVKNIISSTELAFARNPNIYWIDDPREYTDGPEEDAATNAGLNKGIGIRDAVSVYLQISPAYYNTGKSSFHTVSRTAFLVGEIYTVTLDGGSGATAYTNVGTETTVPDVVQAIVDDINAGIFNTTDGGVAYAIAGSGDGVIDTVWVYQAGGSFSVNATCSTLTVATDFPSYVDATAVSARVWAQFISPSGLPITMPWGLVSNGDLGSIPAQGYVERLNAAGFSRIYVELYSITKDAGDGANMVARPFLAIAPAIPEDN